MEPQTPPPPPSPFNPAPQPAVPQRSGCSKPVIIGCVVAFLIGAVAVLGGLYYIGTHADALLKWSFRQMENGLVAQLPKDVTPAEKERLQKAFADVREGLERGTIKPEELQTVNFQIMGVARKGKDLSRQDILDLTKALEEAAHPGGGSVEETPPAAEAP